MLFTSMNRLDFLKPDLHQSHAIELRLDLLPFIDLHRIKTSLENASCPIMLTLRKASHGGRFQGSEEEREYLIEQLLALHPPFFDLEYDMRPKFLELVFAKYPQTKFVLSYHNFHELPSNLETIYLAMQKHAPFCSKMAIQVNSTIEALKLLLFGKNHPNTSVICMGNKGSFARVLGPICGNVIDYACLNVEEKTAPGQITEEDFTQIYHYPSLNKETAIYGLIGDPVEKSPGHLYHNAVFQKKNLNAVYVKMEVKPHELAEFIPLAQAIGIRGLSVTIPLKEKIVPFIHEIEPYSENIGAVNTLLFDNGKILGTNTDGVGAFDAIENRLPAARKKVVLIGAGGAARAIAFEAKKRGADVLILNRTLQRAEKLANHLGCKAGLLDEIPSSYDILINCSSDPIPFDLTKIQPQTVAMDVVYCPRETAFLKESLRKNCEIIYGEEMFLNQAARQTAFWTERVVYGEKA